MWWGNQMPKIEEHEICLLYLSNSIPWTDGSPNYRLKSYFDDSHLLEETGRGRAPREGTAKWLHSKIEISAADLGEEELWQKDDRGRASPDLLEAFRNLASGQDNERVKLFALNTSDPNLERAVDLLLENGKKANDPRIYLHLKDSADKHLSENADWTPTPIQLSLDKPRLYMFRSGTSILELKVQLKVDGPCSQHLFLEVLNALTRFNDLGWGFNSNEFHSARFRMGDIARALLDGPGANVKATKRVFSAAYCRVSKTESQSSLTEFASRTAKQYTSNYDMANVDDVEVSLRQSFDGKVRATAPEGCAIIVEDSEEEFVQTYRVNAWKSSYLPIAVLVLHEKEAWTELAAGSAKWLEIDEGIEEETLSSLSAIRRKALQVRTAYMSPRISQVADHDTWKKDLETRMHIPELRAAVADDLAATEAAVREDTERMQRQKENERAERYRWVTILAGASVAGVTAFSMVTELFQASGTGNWTWSFPKLSNIGAPTFALPFIAFAGAFIPAALYIRKKLKPDD